MITLMAIAVGSLMVASGVWIYFTIDEHRTRRAAMREINLTHMRHMARMQMNKTEFMLRMGMNTATFPSCSPSRNALTSQENPYVEVPTLEAMYRQQMGMNDAAMERIAKRAEERNEIVTLYGQQIIPVPESEVRPKLVVDYSSIPDDAIIESITWNERNPIPAPEVFTKVEVKDD